MAGFRGFDSAKSINTKITKSKKPEVEEVQLNGLEQYASVDVVIKSLTAIQKTMGLDLKDAMVTHFAKIGVDKKTRPNNFRGVEGGASASCELRARSSASALTEEEIDLLNLNNIPTEVVVDTVETLVFNPAYLSDPVMMGKIEEALKKVKGLPEDVIMRQEGRTKTVVGEGAFEALFSRDITPEDAEALLPVIAVPAIKPTLQNDGLAMAFRVAQALLVPPKKT